MTKKEEMNAIIERVKNDIKNGINADYKKLYALCDRPKYDKYCMNKTQMEQFDDEVLDKCIENKMYTLSDFDDDDVEKMYEDCGHDYADDDKVLRELIERQTNIVEKVEVVNVTAEILDETGDDDEEPIQYYVQGTVTVKVNDWDDLFELGYGDWDGNIYVMMRK